MNTPNGMISVIDHQRQPRKHDAGEVQPLHRLAVALLRRHAEIAPGKDRARGRRPACPVTGVTSCLRSLEQRGVLGAVLVADRLRRLVERGLVGRRRTVTPAALSLASASPTYASHSLRCSNCASRESFLQQRPGRSFDSAVPGALREDEDLGDDQVAGQAVHLADRGSGSARAASAGCSRRRRRRRSAARRRAR